MALVLVQASATLARGEEAGELRWFQPGERVLFLGDSITQDGRYIAIVDTLLAAKMGGDERPDLINLGLRSETASGLSEKDHPFPRPDVLDRIDAALAVAKPDTTFVCYGMNDAIYHPFGEERFAAYRDGVNRVIEKVSATGSKIVLFTPPPFDASSSQSNLQGEGADDYGYQRPFEGYSEVLRRYGDWVKEQVSRPEIDAVIDIYQPLVELVEAGRKRDPDYRYGDGVHPNWEGHVVIAQAVLAAAGTGKDLREKAETFVDAASAEDAERRQNFASAIERHNRRSQAYREFVGAKHFKDKEPAGDETLLETRLAEAGQK
ncbi:hypothetical protein BH23VER1_BH23VER1_16200 [soil metagenome]